MIKFASLEKLFYNINRVDIPFTIENIRYIKTAAYLMIAIKILSGIIGLLFNATLKIEILFLFIVIYIFQYRHEIQLDSKGKIYGNKSK
ncbi:MAG TPA: hypothetical protein DCE23_07540 [Firmicutes bacterium]|nr:hypothetical protein [Bacillota bacterium]